MQKTNKKNKTGFIMIEAAFAIFIVGGALLVFMNVLGLMYRAEFSKRDYVIAANLAQEGVELVRNLRDNNWKSGRLGFALAATGGIFPPNGNYCRDYLGTLAAGGCGDKLRVVTATGFYRYAGGGGTVDSKFSRTINIANAGGGQNRLITSTVTWQPVGSATNTTIEVTDILSAWANAN